MSIAVGEQTGTGTAEWEHPEICDQAYMDSLPTLDPVGNLEFQRYIYLMIAGMNNSGSDCE